MAAQPPPDEQPSGSRGYVFPGYKYVGPGNSLERGVPINKLDAAAKKHDEKYHKITEYYKKTKNYKNFQEQIQAADIEFVNEVATFAPETSYDQIVKWISLAGIEGKHILEKYTGIIYPKVTDQDKGGDMEVPGNVSSIIGTGVQNHNNVHKFQFKKKFTFALESTKAVYTKSDKELNYTTYIHSLPWQYVYFYLTEKEYDDMTKVFHTAKVTRCGIKITNLGNRTPFLTSTSSVNYANANSQTTIGIWENMEMLAPVTMGTNVTAETLYGKTLEKYDKGTDKDPGHSTAQAHLINNKIVYHFKLNNVNKNFLLPPLIMESTILFNATNSIGPIFEKSYTPKDGTFHIDNDGFEDDCNIIRNTTRSNILNTTSAKMSDTGYVKSKTKGYGEATIDNITIGGLYKNAQKDFMGSVGVGIVPLLNKDGSLEDAILNIMVETCIELECISHGTNLLMGKHGGIQPNTLFAGLAIDKYKWNNRYTIAGTPAVDAGAFNEAVDVVPATPMQQSPEQPWIQPPEQPQSPKQPQQPKPRPGKRKQTEDTQKDVQSKKTKTWYTGEHEIITMQNQEYLVIRAEKIPGQKKITKTMTDEEKLDTALKNEELRQAAVQIAEKETGKRIMLTGKFLNLGIPEGGYYIPSHEAHRKAILDTATTPKPVPAKPPSNQMERPIQQTTPATPSTTIQTPTQIEEPPPETVTVQTKELTQLVIQYEGTRTTMWLYENEQQLRDQFKTNVPNKVKVQKQPEQNYISFGIKPDQLWPTLVFKLRELTQEERGEIYHMILKTVQQTYPKHK
uniref:Phospholipase A2-like domain-containing protein n=1 Tax=Heliothis virescens TaxID=7102 RepID=A0A2A4J3C3_HELVI